MNNSQYALLILIILGIIIGVICPEIFGESLSNDLKIGLSVVGGLTTFGGGFWHGNLRYNRENLDERFIKIHHRAGWNGFWALFTLLGTSILVSRNTSVSVALAEVDIYLMFLGLLAYTVSVAWYKRTR